MPETKTALQSTTARTADPYATPNSESTDTLPLDSELALPLRGRRLLAHAVDRVVCTVLDIGLILALAILLRLVRGGHVGGPSAGEWILVILVLGPVLSPFFYRMILEGLLGRTLGKLVAGTKVVASSGAPATINQIWLRTLARMIPLDSLSIFFRSNGQCWHDTWSGTKVVRVR
jgi:uncharacterized RDD family membrane protein YckC